VPLSNKTSLLSLILRIPDSWKPGLHSPSQPVPMASTLTSACIWLAGVSLSLIAICLFYYSLSGSSWIAAQLAQLDPWYPVWDTENQELCLRTHQQHIIPSFTPETPMDLPACWVSREPGPRIQVEGRLASQ
jgi:hypothetical protein